MAAAAAAASAAAASSRSRRKSSSTDTNRDELTLPPIACSLEHPRPKDNLHRLGTWGTAHLGLFVVVLHALQDLLEPGIVLGVEHGAALSKLVLAHCFRGTRQAGLTCLTECSGIHRSVHSPRHRNLKGFAPTRCMFRPWRGGNRSRRCRPGRCPRIGPHTLPVRCTDAKAPIGLTTQLTQHLLEDLEAFVDHGEEEPLANLLDSIGCMPVIC